MRRQENFTQKFKKGIDSLVKNLKLPPYVSLTITEPEPYELDFEFKLDFPNKASVVIVGKADNTTNSNIYPTGVFVSWTQSADFIQINNISGLQVGSSYKIRLVAFGDEN